jgi:cobalt-zinc-cadmium efflux system outer membrane protein
MFQNFMKIRAHDSMRIPLRILLAFCAIGIPALAAQSTTPPVPAHAPSTQAPASTARRLTLQEAFSIAERQNLNLSAERLRRAVSLAGVTIAGQRPNPSVSAAASRDTPHESVFFDLPLELGGKRSTRIEEAKQEVALTDIEIATLSREIRRQVRDAFYTAAHAKSELDQLGELADLSRKLRDVANDRFNAGDVPQLEVMQADLELSRAEADREVARQEMKVAFVKLNALLNVSSGTEWELMTPLETLPQAVALADVSARAAESNYDLTHLAQELKVEQSKEKMYRAERFPEVTVEAGLDFNSPPDFKTGARGQLTVGVPIFYRYQGELAQSSATQRLIEAEIAAKRRQVSGDVEAAYAELNARLTEVDLYRRTVIPAGRKLESLTEESYRAGKTNILSVIEAQRTVRQNERNYLQSLLELQKAFSELEETVGVPLD